MHQDYVIRFSKDSGLALYDIFLILACLSALVIFDWFSKLRRMDPAANKFFYILGLVSIIAGAFSAMLFQSVYNWIASGFAEFEFRGMTFMGGLAGGAIAFIVGYNLFAKPEVRREFWKLAEIAPACVAFAHGVGRIGCFFGGCCYGVETDSFLGVQFPHLPNPVHPTMLYEAAFLFALFGLLYYFTKKDIRYSLAAYCIGYSVFRFLIEFLRGDPRGELVPTLSPSQALSVLLLLIGAGLLVLNRLRSTMPDKVKGILPVLFECQPAAEAGSAGAEKQADGDGSDK